MLYSKVLIDFYAVSIRVVCLAAQQPIHGASTPLFRAPLGRRKVSFSSVIFSEMANLVTGGREAPFGLSS